MPFSNIPVKNPGRYLEKFVKIVQPIGAEAGQAQGGRFCNKRCSSIKIKRKNYDKYLYFSSGQIPWSQPMATQCQNAGAGSSIYATAGQNGNNGNGGFQSSFKNV